MSFPDPLSEALRDIRLSGAIFLDAELSAPWGFAAPPAREGAELIAPSAEHVILFHLVVEGRANARLPGHPRIALEPGDIAILPFGDGHALWNGRVRELTDSSALLPKILEHGLVAEYGGGGGPVTRFICGYIGCDRLARRFFLSGLPPLFKVNIRDGASGAWMEHSIRHLASLDDDESAGRHILLAKLAEALFIEALRRHMAALPAQRAGWLAAARDSTVGRALAAIHRKPGHAWTVASLAEHAGVSRTVFAERFNRLLGEAPLAYVTRCRMQLAARLLETTDDTVLQVALHAGYDSEAAFNRAFKREHALPPARYRTCRRAGKGTDAARH